MIGNGAMIALGGDSPRYDEGFAKLGTALGACDHGPCAVRWCFKEALWTKLFCLSLALALARPNVGAWASAEPVRYG